MKTFTLSLTLCAVLMASGAAQAALVDRGAGLIYDTDLMLLGCKMLTWQAAIHLESAASLLVDTCTMAPLSNGLAP